MSQTANDTITIIGGGLAGSEAALWLAGQGVKVRLVEQKPLHRSPAHQVDGFAELVCSNSLKAERMDSAAGLLKAEMRLLGSHLLQVADGCRVAAGGALAVDREAFSTGVGARLEAHPLIEIERRQAEAIPESGITLVATGPLTDGPLAGAIEQLAGGTLSFYDAAAPIVTAESLDMGKIFAASRYDRGDADYLNCPFDKVGYEAFHAALLAAESAPLHDFDQPPRADGMYVPGATPETQRVAQHIDPAPQPSEEALPNAKTDVRARKMVVYEGCMPVEVMARRGPDTLRFGPMRPVGLRDPRTGHRPWANVQLRRENAEGTLYNLVGFQTNLKFGEQKRVFGMIPGLENAEFARYGVMHRNTFLDSPRLLADGFCLKTQPDVFFSGQITGFEGYMESAACGLLAARAALARLSGQLFSPPPAETMCGALSRYVTAENADFQPMGANMGLLPPLAAPEKNKRERYRKLSVRALAAMAAWDSQKPDNYNIYSQY